MLLSTQPKGNLCFKMKKYGLLCNSVVPKSSFMNCSFAFESGLFESLSWTPNCFFYILIKNLQVPPVNLDF